MRERNILLPYMCELRYRKKKRSENYAKEKKGRFTLSTHITSFIWGFFLNVILLICIKK